MRFPMFGIGFYAKSHNVTAQRRVNMYYESSKQEDKSKLTAYGTAGLRLAFSFGETPCRCAYTKGDFAYFVHRGTFYEVNNAGVKTARGTLNTTTGNVDIADNGVQIMLVDGTDGYIYNTSTNAFNVITDVDFVSTPRTVTFLAGYFIVTLDNSGRYYISAQYDGLVWDALDFANAESHPDDTLRSFSANGQLINFGQSTTEFAGVSGGEQFPFSAIQGSAIEFGLVARFSVAKFNGGVMFLARSDNNEISVRFLQGYQSVEVSDHEVTNFINGLDNPEAATAYSYDLDGHPMYVLNIGGRTLLYDGSTDCWSDLKSNGITRHLAEFQCPFINNTLVTDYLNGNVYYLDKNYYSDNGEPIVRELIGRHIFDNQDLIKISEFQLDMETGVGIANGQGSNPQVMMTISKDNGHTYGAERWKPMGAIGTYLTRVVWYQLGQARDFVIKIRITDPIKVVVTGAYIEVTK